MNVLALRRSGVADACQRAAAAAHAVMAPLRLVVPALLTAVLVAAAWHSYLLFHTLAELFSIVVAVCAFLVAWNGHAFFKNDFLMFLGVALFWVGGLDLMHTLAYRGMGVLAVTDTNPATQLWIATRYLQAVALLAAPLYLARPFARMWWFIGLGLVSCAIYVAVISGHFPDAFIEGSGLTPFKIYSEYAVIALFAAGLAHLWARRRLVQRPVLERLSIAIGFLIASEFAFTQYLSPYGMANLVGHVFKLFAYWLFYGALVEFALRQPIEASFSLDRELHALNARLEQRVVERTTQLEAVNKELEAFAYSASHDLRAPLRAIGGFAAALDEDFAGRLDPQAADYVRRIRAASERMAQIIEDLLQLSRLTSREMTSGSVDLAKLARAVARDLQEREPGRKVEVRVSDAPAAWADAHLVRAVLENLLGNAWKFTGKRSEARIEFEGWREGAMAVYRVRDNGAGFDPAHAEKLFTPFVRMHAAAEFPGTGIGLATVRRIVQRHGGRVWAQGAPGRGAQFSFSLPVAADEGGAA